MGNTKKFRNWLLKPVTKNPIFLRPFDHCNEFTPELLSEEHHRIYGRPWIVGRYYMDFLLQVGLNPNDEVIEIGCGAGRLGARLISYLNSGKYYGIDNDIDGLNSFNSYEVFYWGCESKTFRLLHDSHFSLETFEVKAKWFLDFWVSAHLTGDQKELLARKVNETSEIGSRYVVTPRSSISDYLTANSFRLIFSDTIIPPFLRGLGEVKQQIEFAVYEKTA